jgi:hypothetical protein
MREFPIYHHWRETDFERDDDWYERREKEIHEKMIEENSKRFVDEYDDHPYEGYEPRCGICGASYCGGEGYSCEDEISYDEDYLAKHNEYAYEDYLAEEWCLKMDNERKQWREELRRKLSELVETAKVIHELTIDHPDISNLLEDVIQVLRGYDGSSLYISANEHLELYRLYGLLQWITRTEDDIKVVHAIRDVTSNETAESTRNPEIAQVFRYYPPNADHEK